MKKWIYLFSVLIVFACGDSKDEAAVVNLDKYEDRLSYVLGAVNAKMFTESKDANFDKMDKKEIVAGFKQGLDETEADDCNEVLKNFLGPYGQDFNEKYMKEGANCLGRLTAVNFMKEIRTVGEDSKLVKDKIVLGFEMALNGSDTLVDKTEQTSMMDEFFKGIQEREAKKIKELDAGFWEKTKAIPGIKALAEGVYLEVIKEGKGAMPAASDDVEAHYVLTNTAGTVMESTKQIGAPIKINLTHGMGGGIIRGWTIGFASMKKGGQYKLYVPSELAYGQGALTFEVELLNFGPQGSMVTLQQPQTQTGF